MNSNSLQNQIDDTVRELSELYVNDIRIQEKLSGHSTEFPIIQPIKNDWYEANIIIERSENLLELKLYKKTLEKACRSFSKNAKAYFFLYQSRTPIQVHKLGQRPSFLSECTLNTEHDSLTPIDISDAGIHHFFVGIAFVRPDGGRLIDRETTFAINIPERPYFDKIQELKRRLQAMTGGSGGSNRGGDVYQRLVAQMEKDLDMIDKSSISDEEKEIQREAVEMKFREDADRFFSSRRR